MLQTAHAEWAATLSLQLVFADHRLSGERLREVAFSILDVPTFVFCESLRVGGAPLHCRHSDAPLELLSDGNSLNAQSPASPEQPGDSSSLSGAPPPRADRRSNPRRAAPLTRVPRHGRSRRRRATWDPHPVVRNAAAITIKLPTPF